MAPSRRKFLRSARLRASLFSRLGMERLEPRMVLASDSIFELGQLLPENGGDGTKGFVIHGPSEGSYVGASVGSGGDVNGDGLDDFIIGAHFAETPGLSGRAYVVFGNSSPIESVDLGALDGTNGFEITGPSEFEGFGQDVKIVADVNGDGLADILIGEACAGDYSGQVYVIFGRKDGFSRTFDATTVDGTTGFRVVYTPSLDFSRPPDVALPPGFSESQSLVQAT